MKTVFISGIFDILHPGHIRFIKFASSLADRLIVGIIPDKNISGGTFINEKIRLESMKSINYVNQAIILNENPEIYIRKVKPDIVVKGDEFKNRLNPEEAEILKYGGKLIFSSGKFNFSTSDLVNAEVKNQDRINLVYPHDFATRHKIKISKLTKILNNCSNLRICVVGDLIVDEYISCETLGMSQEDSSVVFNPIEKKRYVGGAGIVAAHAAALSNNVNLITLTGNDEASQYCDAELEKYGVKCHFIKDDTLETVIKVRYTQYNKTIFRLNHLKQNKTTTKIKNKFVSKVKSFLRSCDLIIFSDFNYGVLSKEIVDQITKEAKKRNIFISADSQISSQLGNINKFKNVDLMMPTEYEIRQSLYNSDDGLVELANKLRNQINIKQLIITLGGDGAFLNLQSKEKIINDHIPALNKNPKNISGAGDAMLVYTSIALAFGANPCESTLIGSLAAAAQVSREGNKPVNVTEIEKLIL